MKTVTGSVVEVAGCKAMISARGEFGEFSASPLLPMRTGDRVCFVLYDAKVVAISNFTLGTEVNYRPRGLYKSGVNKGAILCGIACLQILAFLSFGTWSLIAHHYSGVEYVMLVLSVLWFGTLWWIWTELHTDAADFNARIDAQIQDALVNAAADTSIWEDEKWT
jgi:hypothetical protein